MTVDGWEIPARLQRLLAEGKWPRTVAEESAQNQRPLVPLAHVHRFALEERGIFLLAPPAHSTPATPLPACMRGAAAPAPKPAGGSASR